MDQAKKKPEQLIENEYVDLIWDTPNPMAVFSPDDRLMAANTAFQEMLFVDPQERPTWREFMHRNYTLERGAKIRTDDIEEWLTAAASRRGTVPYRAFEAELHGGQWLWVTETVLPDGTLVFVGSDVTALKPSTRAIRKERDAARRDAWTDDLTGVANRRYVMSQLALRLEELQARPEPAYHAVALIDLDNFKAINDEFGHEFGDSVLIAFGRLAVNRLRVNDLFGRIGGEEFLLLMPNCPIELAKMRVEDLLAATRESAVVPEAPDFRFTFSAGVISMSKQDTTDGILKRADRLLYEAKDLGRNCVVTEDNLS